MGIEVRHSFFFFQICTCLFSIIRHSVNKNINLKQRLLIFTNSENMWYCSFTMKTRKLSKKHNVNSRTRFKRELENKTW